MRYEAFEILGKQLLKKIGNIRIDGQTYLRLEGDTLKIKRNEGKLELKISAILVSTSHDD